MKTTRRCDTAQAASAQSSVNSHSNRSLRSKRIKKEIVVKQASFSNPNKFNRKITQLARENSQFKRLQQIKESDQESSNGMSASELIEKSRKDHPSREKYIGGLTTSERQAKVQLYLKKKAKRKENAMKKHVYKNRQQVAEKRLRIRGRFVTREQAYVILGLTRSQLLDNIQIQDMLTQHADEPVKLNSLIDDGKGKGQMIKVSNFQALVYKDHKIESNLSDSQKLARVVTGGLQSHSKIKNTLEIISDRATHKSDEGQRAYTDDSGERSVQSNGGAKSQKQFMFCGLLAKINNASDSGKSGTRQLFVTSSSVQPIFKIERIPFNNSRSFEGKHHTTNGSSQDQSK